VAQTWTLGHPLARKEAVKLNSFVTWLFAGIGVAVGSAVPTLVTTTLGWLRRAWAWLIDRMQPAEHYNSLRLTTWAVEVVGRRENPEDPVVLNVKGDRGRELVQSITKTGMVAEPLTTQQRRTVQAAGRDYGPSGPGYWRRHLPEWTRRELILARLFAVSRATERCMVYGGTVPDSIWVVVCNRPRWHRGAHRWDRFSVGTLVAEDPGPPAD
jgi:hypothetical protein